MNCLKSLVMVPYNIRKVYRILQEYMERIKRLIKFSISFILYTKENLDNLVLKEYYKFKVLLK